jgi:hypothetical protein
MSFFSTTISGILWQLPYWPYDRQQGVSVQADSAARCEYSDGLCRVVAGLIVFLLLSRSGPLVCVQLTAVQRAGDGMRAGGSDHTRRHEPFGVDRRTQVAQIRESAIGMGLSYRKQLFYTILRAAQPADRRGAVRFREVELRSRRCADGGREHPVIQDARDDHRHLPMVTNMGRFQFAIALGILLLAHRICDQLDRAPPAAQHK